MKKLLSIILTFFLIFTLSACGKKSASDPIVGNWTLCGCEMGGTEYSMDELNSLGITDTATFTINEDGTFTYTAAGQEDNGTWKKDGDKYSLEVSGNGAEAEIKDGKLYLDVYGIKMIFEQ